MPYVTRNNFQTPVRILIPQASTSNFAIGRLLKETTVPNVDMTKIDEYWAVGTTLSLSRPAITMSVSPQSITFTRVSRTNFVLLDIRGNVDPFQALYYKLFEIRFDDMVTTILNLIAGRHVFRFEIRKINDYLRFEMI